MLVLHYYLPIHYYLLLSTYMIINQNLTVVNDKYLKICNNISKYAN